MFNCTLRSGSPLRQWLTTVITPVPKTSCSSTISDFKPISVTPILSCIIEKIVVHRWLRPAIDFDLIADQFAFRPSVSTTCALIYFMHHIIRMLESNAYVRCLLADFSKAFDQVDHAVLLKKLSRVPLLDCIFNWLMSFLTGRSHTIRCFGIESHPLPINLNIIQGSGLGPTFYIILESDLKATSATNVIFKYADDTNLLDPGCMDVQLHEEFKAIFKRAALNKMTINMAKTKEIVFRCPNPKLDIYLPSLPAIEQISKAKLLGVIFSNNFHFDTHSNFILKVCNPRSYLIRRLRDQGLSRKHLNNVFDAIILS
jgi:Reverse transcriptase (RNA-dependent DNA polymerase)